MSRFGSTEVTETTSDSLLTVNSLSVQFRKGADTVEALRDVSLSIEEGETLAIAGESGSGKSTLAYAIIRYLDENGEITGGSIRFRGRNLTQLPQSALRSIRGSQIAHVAQNPSLSLNPNLPIGEQIRETIRLHQDVSATAANDRVNEVLQQVNIPDPERAKQRYVHELSGGQQQRALLAIALSCNPDLLILDEPTTGLDVTTQAKILDLIDELKTKYDVAIMLITHNLGVISTIADRVNILYAGEFMEKGTIKDVFANPANPYTQGLLSTIPELKRTKELTPIPGRIPDLTAIPNGCIFADRCAFVTDECRTGDIPLETVDESGHKTRCIHWETAIEDPIEAPAANLTHDASSGDPIIEAEGLQKHYDEGGFLQSHLGHRPVRAVDGVNLTVHEGETVGLVGESGCGKSTLGRVLLGLLDRTAGDLRFRGEDIDALGTSGLKRLRSECQIVFQDPDASLNPQKRIYSILNRPLKRYTDLGPREREDRICTLLEQVNLGISLASKYPHELSGGEKQRVAIARAFSVTPSLIVLDEPLSALDVSIQASIINLLDDLREKYNVSYLLISHDLSVVKVISDRIAVMYLGEIVEKGENRDVFSPPYHPYTRSLMSSIPTLDPDDTKNRIHLEGDVPSPRDPPSGCSFHTRCPQYIGEVCEEVDPELEEFENDHCISCHHDESELDGG